MPSYFFHIVFDLDATTLTHSSQPVPVKRSDSDTIREPSKLEIRLGAAIDDSAGALSNLPTVSKDWRYDKISTQDIIMQSMPLKKEGAVTGTTSKSTGHVANGISAGPGGLATKGKYKPLDPQNEELGWGVVRLYRDSEETPGLYDEPEPQKTSKHAKNTLRKLQDTEVSFRDEDCTTLCILAVPSYLMPSDFLGFIGEKTREEVSHFRMIRTERVNRYMVLMKFRDGKKAREWRRAWNGKPFDGMDVGLQSLLFLWCS